MSAPFNSLTAPRVRSAAMTSHDLLRDTVAALGYGDAAGFVDAETAPAARGFIWADLRDKCRVDAAYFRGSVPVVAFAAAGTRSDIHRTQRRLWNYGRVPLLIATTESEVLALSCNTSGTPRQPEAALIGQAEGSDELRQVLSDFSRFSVESGRLMRLYPKALSKRNRVDQSLLRNLRQLRSRLVALGVDESDIEPLLGRSIFVRYLEDRGILRPEDLRSLGQPTSLVAALDDNWNAVSSFFDAMSDHFNGDVFRTGVLSRPIPQPALDDLGSFFRATDLDSGQQALWPYDFAIIPSELISSIYEQLLATKQKKDAAYYTPRHVVDLVLDELLPPDRTTGPRALLDPSCGSGIFLAEAFRRMVRQESLRRGTTLNFAELSQLLTSSVFGVDRNADAIGVTAFSLYLALLEHVDPRTIWLTARLPDLIGSNLVIADYFDDHALADRKFDAIAGNPPWQSRLSPAANRYLHRAERDVPDQQIAAAFIWRAAEMLTDQGSVGFVLPSKTILHNRGGAADRFRLEFFSSLSVETIIDLSPLRKELFGATAPATIAIFGPQSDVNDTNLLHVSPRRTPIAQMVDGIAIPQQNIRWIPSVAARTDPSIWKPLLWGGPADLALVQHLRQAFPSLRHLEKERDWSSGPGFQIVRGGDENDASHLANIPHLPTDRLQAMRPPAVPERPATEAVMHRPRQLAIYLAPHILMRKGFSEFPEAAFVPYNATFTDGLSSLAGPHKEELQAIAALLNSSVARYWFLMTASSWGVEREQLHHREWMTLPIPPLDGSQLRTLSRFVLRAAEGEGEDLWRPELDDAAERAYGLTADERQLVADALDVSWSELRHGPTSAAYHPPTSEQYDAFATGLATRLEDLDVGGWDVAVAERTRGLAVVTCRSREEPGGPDVDASVLQRLTSGDGANEDRWLASATIIEPEALVLDGNAVHLIRPDRLSCWTVSSARQSAIEVFEALLTGTTALQERDA